MGKEWDNEAIAFGVDFWREALRVLKPGGHVLAFGGTRTYHRLAAAMEDAGAECRDCLFWIHGQGFPKSLDVSKVIDKHGGADIAWFGPWLRQERKRRGVTQKELARRFPSKTGGLTGCVANWELGLNLPTAEQFNTLCAVLNLPFTRIEEAEREVIGAGKSGKTAIWNEAGTMGDYDITAPATDAARQWDGWGTALKPAVEPIILCRKPLAEGTVAANVLTHGTGALNIDGCRIAFTSDGDERESKQKNRHTDFGSGGRNEDGSHIYGVDKKPRTNYDATGRWPAHLVLDEDAARMLDAQSGVRAPGHYPTARGKGGLGTSGHGGQRDLTESYAEPSGASRFFYVAKASRAERDAGCERIPEQAMNWSAGTQNPGSFQSPNTHRAAHNHHPTVKPLALMRWLCRLITPPGGLVLDLFAGSCSTLIAAAQEGFDYLGIEREAEYVEIGQARLAHALRSIQPEPVRLVTQPTRARRRTRRVSVPENSPRQQPMWAQEEVTA